MKKPIDITNIEINSKPNNQSIKIHFRYNLEEEKKVSIKLFENFFGLGYRAIGGDINLKKGINYWISDTYSNGLVYRLNQDVTLFFDDINKDNETIYKETINIGNYNLLHRSRGKNMSLKNVWFLSDSNGYHYFSKYPYNSNEYFFEDKVLINIDVPELSVNRFVNSDVQKFINTLPLFENDIIILNLGEIDCRVSLYRNSKLKGRTLISHINNVLDRYVDKINELVKSNKKIEFIICSPHPALRDGWVKEHDVSHLLNKTTEKDRLFIRDYFIRYLTDKLDEINVKHINPFVGLENSKGFIKDEFLLPFDNHTNDNDIVLNELKNLI